MEKISCVHPSLSPNSSDTDSLNAPSAADSPPISLTNPSFSSPASTYTGLQSDEGRIQGAHIHGANASPEEGRLSVSSSSGEQMVRQHACDVHANGDAMPHQPDWDASPIRGGGALNDGDDGNSHGNSRCRVDGANPSQPSVESSGSDADVEKGWGPANVKQVVGEEEVQVECCRVCHLTVDRSPSSGEVIKLGCACKDDLALAHRRCAETWFKIKGNRTCEICGSTAQNILGSGDANFMDHWNDGEASHSGLSRTERCWQNQPLCNTVLVCVILVLIASWLFRVTLF